MARRLRMDRRAQRLLVFLLVLDLDVLHVDLGPRNHDPYQRGVVRA